MTNFVFVYYGNDDRPWTILSMPFLFSNYVFQINFYIYFAANFGCVKLVAVLKLFLFCSLRYFVLIEINFLTLDFRLKYSCVENKMTLKETKKYSK